MVDHKLITLLALVEAGSYTQAARSLNLTQPAVSHHIRQLEEELGVRIFARRSRALKLTPAGRILLKYARQASALYTGLLQDLEAQRAGVAHVVVGITPSVEETLAPWVMASYCASHPDSRITIFSDSPDSLCLRLRTRELDMAIAEGPVSAEGLVSVHLDTDRLCLVASPEHPLAKAGGATLAGLKKERLILRTPQAEARRLLDDSLARRSDSIGNFHVILETDSLGTIRELVASGLGVAVCSALAARDRLEQGSLLSFQLEEEGCRRSLYLVTRRDRILTELEAELCRFVREGTWERPE